jgi:hypothetical protein
LSLKNLKNLSKKAFKGLLIVFKGCFKDNQAFQILQKDLGFLIVFEGFMIELKKT